MVFKPLPGSPALIFDSLQEPGWEEKQTIIEFIERTGKLHVTCGCGRVGWVIDAKDVAPGEEVVHMCPANCGRGVVLNWKAEKEEANEDK